MSITLQILSLLFPRFRNRGIASGVTTAAKRIADRHSGRRRDYLAGAAPPFGDIDRLSAHLRRDIGLDSI